MNGRQHLILDALGQTGILLVFGFMIAKSEQAWEVVDILAIFLFLWQIINAFLSYRYFERTAKALFVKIAAWALIGLCGFLGLLLFVMQLQILSVAFADQSVVVIEKVVPYIFGIFAIWCLVITFKELYHTVFNRI